MLLSNAGRLCGTCEKPLNAQGKVVEALGMFFHPECVFACTGMCGVAFTEHSSCLFIGGAPYCNSCGKAQFKQVCRRQRLASVTADSVFK
jgi:hypothetical protein